MCLDIQCSHVLPHSAQLLCRTLEGIDDLLAICSQDVRLTNFLLVYLHAIVKTLLVLATTTAAAAATAIGTAAHQRKAKRQGVACRP